MRKRWRTCSTRTFAAEKERLTSFNLSFLTRLRPCTELENLCFDWMNLRGSTVHLLCVDSKPSLVAKSRFEIDEDNQTAYIEFETDGSGWMTIWHTDVPSALRGRSIATELARAAFEHARKNHLRVDVICPSALQFLSQHPEYKPLAGKEKG